MVIVPMVYNPGETPGPPVIYNILRLAVVKACLPWRDSLRSKNKLNSVIKCIIQVLYK